MNKKLGLFFANKNLYDWLRIAIFWVSVHMHKYVKLRTNSSDGGSVSISKITSEDASGFV